ncbi:MAG: tetratricopeptide repeat protein [Gemmatimonadaceae bacterium]|nr:tetratricopeptide repeat protein [Gemmatimonadaceae bacterium]
MAIRGSLREASLPDVLQLLAMGKKSGCLSVTHRHAFGNIFFDRGRISFASIVNRRDRLGDLLVKHGLISRGELDDAIALQSGAPGRKIGEILIEHRVIAREELHQYIKHQIEEAVYFLFTWTEGTFSFEADVQPDAQDILVSINPESLLLEGARRIDEWSLIEKKISSFDLIFAIDLDHIARAQVILTPEQEVLAPLVDGRRDVTALVDESGLGEFEVGKALYGLLTAGFLQGVGRARAPDQLSTESRVTEHRNLGVAFYKTGMLDEAVREFRRVVELQPGDEHGEFYLGLLALRQGRLDEALRLLRSGAARPTARGATHLNLACALERAGRLEEARTTLTRAAQLLPNDPVVPLAAAVLALRRHDVDVADRALQDAAALWEARARPAAWFHYAGLVAAVQGELDRAIAVLTEGTTVHPHSAVLLNNLVTVLERRGRYAEAAAMVERAQVEDPALPQLHKNAGDLHYRAGRYDEALECYQRAVRVAPELGGDVWLKLGNIRFRRRERDEAMTCWERSLALAPENPMARNNLDTAQRLA